MTQEELTNEYIKKVAPQSEQGKYTQPRPQTQPKTSNDNWFTRQQNLGKIKEQEASDRIQARQEADAKRYEPQLVGNADISKNFSTEEGLDGDLSTRIDDIINQTSESGANANAAMQNIKVPRNKMLTIRDIMNDPELEGMRDYLVADKIGTMWQNVGENIAGRAGSYKSKLDEYNDAMNQTYAQNKSNVDKSATQANLDAINAGLAQQVALETSLADTVANEYIQRYKSQQDAESKKLLLQKMATDSEVWAKLNPEGKLNLAGYMGILTGNYSLTELLIQKYAPQMLSLLDAFMDKITDGKWSDWKTSQNTENPDKDEEPPQKKNDEPIVDENLVYGIPGAEVSQSVYESNPDDYAIIPLKNGTKVVVRKFHALGGDRTTPEQEKAVMDMLVNDSAYENVDELYQYVKNWAPLAPGKVVDAQKAYNEKVATTQSTVNALYSIRDNLKNRKITGEEALTQLQTINDEYLDPSQLRTKKAVMEQAYGYKASETYDLVSKDNKISSSEKIRMYDSILNGVGNEYMSPITRQKIKNAKSDCIARRDYIDPLNETANTWFGEKAVIGEDGVVRKGKAVISKPGRNTIYGVKGAESEVERLDGLLQKTYKKMEELGVLPGDMHLYVSKSGIGAYLKQAIENSSLKNVVENAGKKSKVYEDYETLVYRIDNLTR